MPSMLCSNMTAGVAAGATVDVQPPAGQAYVIRHVGNDAAFVANVPDIETRLRDGALADAIIQNDPTVDPGRRQRPLELYITNANFLRIYNRAGGAGNISYFGERVNASNVRVDLVTIGAGAEVNIQPPAGEVWRITEIGASTWTGAGDLNPNVTIRITNGVLVASILMQPTMVRGQDKPLDLIINNTTYLRVLDSSAAGIVFGYSGVRIPNACISSIQDVAGSATLDIQPPAGEEWVITEIAAETWAGGGAPNNYPNILVSMRVGANLSDILEAGSVATSLLWNQRMEILVDNTHYLRITEVSAANNEVGVLGYLKRQYS